jgi:hypothetical protein
MRSNSQNSASELWQLIAFREYRAVTALVIFSILALTNIVGAQTRSLMTYIDARELTLIGKIPHSGPFFHRLDTAAYPAAPPP